MTQKNIPHKEDSQENFVFGKSNYRLMLLGIAEFRKIVLAPIVVLAGFAIGFIAILKKPAQKY